MSIENSSSKKLFLLDAYALIYRSYFAFIRNPRYNSKKLNTSAMLGFVNTLEQVLNREDPTHIAVVFDVHAPTFRHKLYEPYKANREEMPEDLRKAIPWVRKIIEAYRIPIIEKEGFEADDVIGTLAKEARGKGYETYMMTPDKDYAQLVTDKVMMYKPGRKGNDVEIWGVDQVCQHFEIERPEQVIDILGLMGDTADNIPGCPGIGPKTAMKLIGQYGSIDNLYLNINDLKGKQKERLIENEEQVRLSRKLVVIIQDVPIEFNEKALVREKPDTAQLQEIFNELEFRNMARKLGYEEPVEQKPVVASTSASADTQGSLFVSPEQTDGVFLRSDLKHIDTTEHHYFLAENEMQRATLRADLAVCKEFCFDTETTGLNTHEAELVCLSFAFKPGEAYCVPLPENRDEALKILEEFRLVFEDPKIRKIGQNIKYDLLMLREYGIEVKGELYDTMIAHYLIQPELRHNLDALCEIYLNYQKVETESLIGKKGRKQLTMRDVPVDRLVDYSCEDADLTLQLKLKIDPELDKTGVREVFTDIEMPLIPVLVDMEMAGVTLNIEALNTYAGVLREQIQQLEEEIIELAGESFNVSSPKQLGPILFEKLKIDTKAKRTKTKQYSTSEEVLSKLVDKHPIVSKILEFRGLKKLLSTYVEALPLLVNKRTGRIHTSFNQAVAATGRLSSTNPNLQNIPIRDENGREIRKSFTASDEDHLFLSADYSQIELRIMAALSGDQHLSDAFKQGLDIHAATAAKIYHIPLEEVSSDMRRKAKTANFGIIYGISAFGLAERLTIPRSEAKQLIDDYFANFGRVKEYMDECIQRARDKGYVETIRGRRRYLKDINSANAIVRGVAERNAINAPIQGSAADIIKLAMINVHREIKSRGLKTEMILQVHDELNFDVPKNEVEEVKGIVKNSMEHAVDLDIPLTVEMNAADNWLDAH